MEGRNVDEQLVGDGVRDYAHPASVAGLEQGSKSYRKIFRSQPSAGIDEGAVDPDGMVTVLKSRLLFFLEVFTREAGGVLFPLIALAGIFRLVQSSGEVVDGPATAKQERREKDGKG